MLPLRDNQPAGIVPIWVILIIVINIFVFYLEITLPNPDSFINTYALIPSLINFSNSQTLFPFISSQFIHAGFIHIISNMWFLWVFGDNVEGKFGILFPFFYITCGIAAGLIQYFFVSDSNIPMIGASGAIAGILGAYYALFSSHRVTTLVPVFGLPAIFQVPASVVLLFWFGIQLLSGFSSLLTNEFSLGGVAWFAHVGGFLVGWFLASVIFAGETWPKNQLKGR